MAQIHELAIVKYPKSPDLSDNRDSFTIFIFVIRMQ